jgi:sugar lactone lactonase YvrE
MKKVLFLILLPLVSNGQIITTIAGGGTGHDGSKAILASIYDPTLMAIDKYGNLYFSEPLSHVVRKIDTAGTITTIAGVGISGYTGDGGLAKNAKLNQPIGLAFDDSNNLYIADEANNRIRKVNTKTGIITTIAGNGATGGPGSYGGDGGKADTAKLNLPNVICFDKYGNLYISDYLNYRVRRVSTSGIISTYAGNGTRGRSGDGGVATSAQFINPGGLAFDKLGNLYISDSAVIRKVNTTGIISFVAGNPPICAFDSDGVPATTAHMYAGILAFDSKGVLYFADPYNNRVCKIDASGKIRTVAGNGGSAFSGDGGLADSAQISGCNGIAFDSCDNMYIAQVNNPRIRKVTFDTSCGHLHGDSTNAVKTSPGLSEGAVMLLPNPVGNSLWLTVSNWQANKNCRYSVIDVMGRKLLSGEIQSSKERIDTGLLHSGIYFIEVVIDNQRIIKNFVKE